MREKNNIDNKAIFETLPIAQAVRIMAVPTIFSQIIVLIYNMADTFYLGQTNNPYMVAGVSLILPIFNITLSLVGLTGVGGGALISRLIGVDQFEEAKKVSSFTFYLSILTTALFSILLLIFIKPVLLLLGASDNTFIYARQYLFFVVIIGGIPTVLSNVIANLLRSIGISKEAGFGITMGGILNIILDPIFMFVILPRNYEVLGVGIATLLSNCIACLYFLWVLYRIRKDSVLSLKINLGLPESKSIKSIFNVGIPSAVATLLFDLDYIVIDKLMSAYHDIALAAIGIVLKVERLPLNVGIGICQGMMPLVAYNYSSKDYKRMFGVIKFSLILGLVISIISIIFYELFASLIIRFFITDPQTLLLGTHFLQIRCLATPLMFLSFFTVYIFQGFGEGNIALFLGIMRWAVFNIPMLYILNAIFGMYGIVWSQVTADILTVTLSLYVFIKFVKKHFPSHL